MAVEAQKKSARFYTAEDIRLESNNNPILIGFFPRDQITLFGITDDPSLSPTKEKPVLLHSLAILTNVIGFKGNHKISMDLIAPDGHHLFKDTPLGEIKTESANEEKEANFVAKFMPFKVTQLGEYKFVIRISRNKYEHKFIIN